MHRWQANAHPTSRPEAGLTSGEATHTSAECKPDFCLIRRSFSEGGAGLSFIWPQHYCRDLAAYPPACQHFRIELGRAALNDWYTWHFSMQGLPFPTITRRDRELLPHVFTITPTVSVGAVIFCGPVCFPTLRVGTPAVSRCIALRCPDFPPSRHQCRESDSLAG
jgi:hypothetical protein